MFVIDSAKTLKALSPANRERNSEARETVISVSITIQLLQIIYFNSYNIGPTSYNTKHAEAIRTLCSGTVHFDIFQKPLEIQDVKLKNSKVEYFPKARILALCFSAC